MASKKTNKENENTKDYETSLNSVQGQSFLKIERASEIKNSKKQDLDDDLEDTPRDMLYMDSGNEVKKTSKNTGSLKSGGTGSLKKEKQDYKIEDHSKDAFDEDGSVYEEEEKALTIKIRELQEKIDKIIDFITDKISSVVNKVKSIVFVILDKVITPFTTLFSRIVDPILEVFKGKKDKVENETQEEEQEKKPKSIEETFEMGTFPKISEMNIIFTDNYDVPMYKPKKDSFATFTKSEEKLILDIAIESIKQCAPFMENQPTLEAGFYAGKKPYDLMMSVKEEDIRLFLGYVTAVPEMYTSQKWKISETFATWIVSNSPMVEKP